MTEAGIITYIQLKSVARHVLIQSKVEAVTQYSAGPVLCWVDFVAVTWWNTVPWVWYWAFFFKTALRELGLALFCGMARGMAMLVGYICPDWNISTFAWIAMTLTIPSDLGDLLAFLLAQACQHFFFQVSCEISQPSTSRISAISDFVPRLWIVKTCYIDYFHVAPEAAWGWCFWFKVHLHNYSMDCDNIWYRFHGPVRSLMNPTTLRIFICRHQFKFSMFLVYADHLQS